MSTGARTNVGDNSPSLMRATLRAPPSKWAIEAFFRRVSAANRGRGQPRRGYRRPKPTARSDVGRLRSRRAACFLWYFLSLRKKVLPPSGRQPHRPRRSRRVSPPRQEICACGRTKGLSSGQTIGAVRTAVRSACCLPELRVANRLRRLYPLDTRFPSFPFGNLRTPKLARNPWDVKSHSLAVVGAPIPLSPLLPSFFQRLYQPKMLPVELQ